METKEIVKKNKMSRKTIQIISILALADVLVMAVPFYLKNVMSSVLISESLGILPSQFSQANSIYGYVALLSYFAGGYLADKISLKKLSLVGLGSVGIIGIWYGFIPFIESGKVAQVYIIFSLWSFVTCFIFWSALWKLLSEQGTKEENGTLNGVHGSLNGLIGSAIIAIAYLVFWLMNDIWNETLGAYAFSALVFVFSGFILLNCFLLWFFVPEHKNESQENGEKVKFELHTLMVVLKNYKVWLATLLIMGVYMFQSGLSVFVTYIQDALLVTGVVVVILGICRTYLFRAFFSVPAGKMADKTQKYVLFITIGLVISSILCVTATLLPGFTETSFTDMSKGIQILIQVLVSALYLMLGITCWALVTNRWATIYEINVDHKQYATAVGFISFLAFSPDAWFWQIDSILLKNFGTENGYQDNKLANQISLFIITGIGLLAAVGGIILMICLKNEKKKVNLKSEQVAQHS
ncbi:MFS transporter [Spiroplasma culicicola]|uniref:Glycerophosphodiester transporter n=1 Tax=Spiroplasma culicicola AES-1 TaxID=1276246 RepID=W6A640_9MOLU|nr:MFS transporter [Spiroplasma culicicola]AHI52411.1 glycerophosphodiester transporter [Spiroplasma culicicola AES-1]